MHPTDPKMSETAPVPKCTEYHFLLLAVDKEAAIRLEPAVSPPTDDPLESTYHGGASSLKNNEAVNFDVNCDQLIANVKLKLSQVSTGTAKMTRRALAPA